MPALILPSRRLWAGVPPGPARPDPRWRATHLWTVAGAAGMRDAVGRAHLGSLNQAVRGVGRYGPAIVGTGSTTTESGAWGADGSVSLVGASEVTLFAVVEFSALTQVNECGILRIDNATAGHIALDVYPSTGKVRPLIATTSATGWAVTNDVTATFTARTPMLIVSRWRAGTQIEASALPIGQPPVWLTGSGTPAGTITVQSASSITLMRPHVAGMSANGLGYPFPGRVYLAGILPYRITDAAACLLACDPWLLFKRRARRSFFSLGSGGALPASASGGAQAGGSAAPSVQVALSGVGVALAGGTAGITAAVPLSAAGFSVVSAAANPSATVTLSAAGLAQAAAAAGISASVLLQASGAAQASGNATLAAHLSMLASGAAQAAGSATATLTGAGQIAAAGSAHADGAAALVVSVSLTAAGASSASGAATLTGGSAGAVSASGAAQATGIGTVQVAVSLTASGFVQAMGAGAFAVQIPLAAIGSATATGSATLHDLAAVALVKDKRFAVGRRRNFAVTRRRVFAVSGRSYAH